MTDKRPQLREILRHFKIDLRPLASVYPGQVIKKNRAVKLLNDYSVIVNELVPTVQTDEVRVKMVSKVGLDPWSTHPTIILIGGQFYLPPVVIAPIPRIKQEFLHAGMIIFVF